jgi:hypothetical protein
MTQRTHPTQETTPAVHPVITVFGGSFFPENHIEGERRNLPPKEKLDFSAVLKSLRAALGIRQAAFPTFLEITSNPWH